MNQGHLDHVLRQPDHYNHHRSERSQQHYRSSNQYDQNEYYYAQQPRDHRDHHHAPQLPREQLQHHGRVSDQHHNRSIDRQGSRHQEGHAARHHDRHQNRNERIERRRISSHGVQHVRSSNNWIHSSGHREGGERSNRHSDVVASHYNQKEEVGREAREDSRILYMRNFNNWIKSMIIGEAIELLNWDYSRRLTVLDIGCGKGGDLQKWMKIGGIHHLICTDIADVSVSQCKDRYQKLVSQHRPFLFSAEFITADATRQKLGAKYKDPSTRIDLVSIQFSFHYCFESYEQTVTMIKNASECLVPGGYVIGTTPDANDIVSRIRKSGSLSVGNDIYSIKFDKDIIKEQVPIFGAQYDFQLEGVVNCAEFLVYFPVFEKIALEHGLKCVFKSRFEDYYHLMKSTEDGASLMKGMKALERYPAHERNKLVGDREGDYVHAAEYMKDLPGGDKGNRALGTLTQSEWEAITMYLVFVFEKIRR